MSLLNSFWPSERGTRLRRGFVALALTFISVAGFASGLGLRPVIQQWQAHQGFLPRTTSQPTATSIAVTHTDLPAMTPESFTLNVTIAPAGVHAGNTITITAHAALLRDATIDARGVSCSPVLDGIALTPPPAPVLTDQHGDAVWTIVVPAATSAGSYKVTVNGRWGDTSYYAFVYLRVGA